MYPKNDCVGSGYVWIALFPNYIDPLFANELQRRPPSDKIKVYLPIQEPNKSERQYTGFSQ